MSLDKIRDIAEEYHADAGPSHDFGHVLRVRNIGMRLAEELDAEKKIIGRPVCSMISADRKSSKARSSAMLDGEGKKQNRYWSRTVFLRSFQKKLETV